MEVQDKINLVNNILTSEQFQEKNYKYNYLYKITNLQNNKIYIGMHSTNNINDGYMGSSKILNQSIRKNGIENFKKEILGYYPDRDSLREAESEIVNEEFIARSDTYNISLGGLGGENYRAYLKKKNEKFKEVCRKNCAGKIWITDGISTNKRIFPDEEIPENFYKGKTDFKSIKLKNGKRVNSCFSDPNYLRSIGKNSKWITNGKENKKLLEGDILPDGYWYGRENSSKNNKNKKWIFNPIENIFKMVPSEEVGSYLSNSWELKSPSNPSIDSKYTQNKKEKRKIKEDNLLLQIKESGIDIENPLIPQKDKIKSIVEAGILPSKLAFNILIRYLPQSFKKSDKTWITDGLKNKKIDKSTPLPEGWKYGTTIRQGPNKNI